MMYAAYCFVQSNIFIGLGWWAIGGLDLLSIQCIFYSHFLPPSCAMFLFFLLPIIQVYLIDDINDINDINE